MHEPYIPPFHIRYGRELKQASVAVTAIVFCAVYAFVPTFQRLADRAIDPAVSGLSHVYSEASTFIFRHTGVNLGLVSVPADQEFLFAVRLATYTNQRRAGPLLDICADTRFPDDKRERAL